MSWQIQKPGMLALIQDVGRFGYARWGLGPSGVLDAQAYRSANALLGNAPGSAVVEILWGDFHATCTEPTAFAITGAEGEVSLDGAAVPLNAPITANPGAQLRIGPARRGMRYYLAVAGGVQAEEFAGSRSRDTLAGMGPAPLATGAVVSSAAAPGAKKRIPPVPRHCPVAATAVSRRAPEPAAPVCVRVLPGPRLDWFVPGTWTQLGLRRWRVTEQSDRVGLRAHGWALQRSRAEQLPSEGVVTGAVQIPADGQPVVFLNDRPVTGGYPIVAVVLGSDLSLLAQARPGQWVRFLPVPDP